MVRTLAALAIVSSVSAFQVGQRSPQRTASSLRATEDFQRSLLAERLGANKVDVGETEKKDFVAASFEAPAAAEEPKALDHEKFQRSLLEAKLEYDTIDSALGTPAVAAVVTGVEEEAVVEVLETAWAEPEPVPEPEPAVAAAAAAPEPVAPKPVVPVEPPKAERVVELAIVPINESTVQFAAGALGAVAGLALGGPAFGAVSAGLFNYLSRKDEDGSSTASAKKIVDAASRTALLAYNFFAQFEKDHKVVDATLKLVERAVDKAKGGDSPAADALARAESALGDVASKVEEWNEEYDLVGGAGTVLDGVGHLVERGVDKAVELNDEYKLVDRAGVVVKGAVDKVAEKW